MSQSQYHNNITMSQLNECTHEDVEDNYCLECGLEVDSISNKNEWSNDKCVSRCYVKRQENRSLINDVKGMGFPDIIVSLADEYYKRIINKKIFRGDTRKAVIFTCILQASKKMGYSQTPEDISNKLNIKKKIISKGLKIFSQTIDDNEVRYIGPLDLIENILKNMNASPSYSKDIKRLYTEKIDGKSTLLKRSNPQSVASGLVFYYCKSKGINISRKRFSEIVNKSEITIIRIAKEIRKITGDDVKL